jgi:hypothetical protein
MATPSIEAPALDEKIWRAWVEKRKVRERATARKMKIMGGVALGIFALGSAIYLLAVRF